MLTFELTKCKDELHIHADTESLKKFSDTLLLLADKGNGHYHLMTKSWGGGELTEELQSDRGELLNMVTVHCWND